MKLLCTEGQELGCKNAEECKECWNRPSKEMLMMNIQPMAWALVGMTTVLDQMRKTSTCVGMQIIGDLESSIMSLTSELNRLRAMVDNIDKVMGE